jgi:pimeloyl-ACP methyl ester carboxylesterase
MRSTVHMGLGLAELSCSARSEAASLAEPLRAAGYRDAPNKIPTAVAVFPQDFRTIRTFAERANNIVRYTEFDQGGHFAYTTDPDLVAGDLREFFADLG